MFDKHGILRTACRARANTEKYHAAKIAAWCRKMERPGVDAPPVLRILAPRPERATTQGTIST